MEVKLSIYYCTKWTLRSIACVFFSLLCTFVQADLTYQQLEKISDSPANIEGTFTQKKYLSELAVNLTSSGIFEYKRDQKIIWRTLQPIENEMEMTPSSIVNRQRDEETLRLDSKKNPSIAAFSEIFFSVLTAQWQSLAKHFNMKGSLKSNQWKAELLPIDINVLNVINRIELEGDQLLRKVVLHETEGDTTTIVFEYTPQ